MINDGDCLQNHLFSILPGENIKSTKNCVISVVIRNFCLRVLNNSDILKSLQNQHA